MSFWNLSDGSSAATAATQTYEAPTGGAVIPDNSVCLAMIDEAKWDDYEGARYISLRWRIAQPDQLKNRVVFQKLWVTDANPQTPADKVAKKRDGARKALAAIDKNAGGALAKLDEPSDADLMVNLCHKPMVIRVMQWAIEGREGNWISAVYPASTPTEIGKALPVSSQTGARASDLDDEIPF